MLVPDPVVLDLIHVDVKDAAEGRVEEALKLSFQDSRHCPGFASIESCVQGDRLEHQTLDFEVGGGAEEVHEGSHLVLGESDPAAYFVFICQQRGEVATEVFEDFSVFDSLVSFGKNCRGRDCVILH